MKPLHVAMIGQRGIPATFGGVERHVEEIGARLVERGHRVDVYSRPGYTDDDVAEYRGMHQIMVDAVETRHLEALSHSAAAAAVAMRSGADVFHFHAIGPGLWSFGPRALRGRAVVQTVHGLDFDREKWSLNARRVLRAAARATVKVPHETIVVAQVLQKEYMERYNRKTTYIPNGVVRPTIVAPGPMLESLGLQGDDYVLFVGRLVPEKAVLPLVEKFLEISTDTKLVIAGGSSHTDDYLAEIQALADKGDRIIMPGYVYGNDLAELYSNAAIFALPSLLEGLPLTLLEALAYQRPVVASNIPAHTQVLGDSAPGRRTFATGDWQDLANVMTKALANHDAERRGTEGHNDLLATYDWDLVTDQVEECYYRHVKQKAKTS